MLALLSTTYFGPIQWYQKLYRYPQVLIEQHETFAKQTFRNRCLIATAQGVQALTVPVVHNSSTGAESTIGHLRISDHGNWRHLHWQAITSAYGDSPFLEYYEDDLRPFFFEHQWEYLFDFNWDICHKICELIDISPRLSKTDRYIKNADSIDGKPFADFREAISPKHPTPDPDFLPRPYYQVFAQRHGFLPNLSILDLLLNMGAESVFYL